MHILIDGRHLGHPHPSGVGHYGQALCRAWVTHAPADTHFTILTTGWSRPDLSWAHAPHITHVHRRVPNKLLFLSMMLFGQPTLERLAGGTYDALWLPNLHVAPTHLPYTLTVHDTSWMIDPTWFSAWMRLWHWIIRPARVIARAARIIVPSQSSAEDVQMFFSVPEARISVIPHGVDAMFQPRRTPQDSGILGRLPIRTPYLLFIGTLEPRKNLPVLIDGVTRYRQETHEPLHLVLCGSFGWKPRALRRLMRPGIQEGWIHHLGYIPSAHRSVLYRGATAFAFPSYTEGFGLPVLEAMACGTPVITSTHGALAELAGDAAITIDPQDPASVARALRRVLHEPDVTRSRVQRGLARASAYRWSRTAEDTLTVILTSHT